MIPAPLLLLMKSKLFWQIAGAVILVLAIISAVAYRDHGIRVKEAAKWKGEVERCQSDLKVALDANKSLQASTEAFAAKVQEQNRKLKELAVMEERARKARDEALAAALAKERMLRIEINRLTVIANAPPVIQTQEVCDAAADLLRSYVNAR